MGFLMGSGRQPRLHYAAARSDKEAVTRLLGICEQVEAQTRPEPRTLDNNLQRKMEVGQSPLKS